MPGPAVGKSHFSFAGQAQSVGKVTSNFQPGTGFGPGPGPGPRRLLIQTLGSTIGYGLDDFPPIRETNAGSFYHPVPESETSKFGETFFNFLIPNLSKK